MHFQTEPVAQPFQVLMLPLKAVCISKLFIHRYYQGNHSMWRLQEVMRVAYMERLAHDTIATGLSKEPSFRGFCEPPTADLLRNLPVGSGGNCYRTAPCVAAARVSSMYIHRRSFAANDAGVLFFYS